MRLSLCLILLAVRSLASDDWSERLSAGQALRNSGNYSAAVQAFREALVIAGRSTVDDWQLVVLHDALAGTYAEAGQFAESEGEYRRALALIQKTEGQGSLHYAVLLAGMVSLPTQTVVPEEVITLLRNAIALGVRSDAAASLTVLRVSLGAIFRNQHRYAEGESLLLDALADLAKQKTPDPRRRGEFLNDLAVLRFDQGGYQESVDLQRESIRVLVEQLGEQHPSLVVPFNNLATTYAKMGRLNDADLTYQLAIRVCKNTLGEDHLSYAFLLENRALVLRKLGRKREAKEVDAQGQQIERMASRRNGVGSTISLPALRSKKK